MPGLQEPQKPSEDPLPYAVVQVPNSGHLNDRLSDALLALAAYVPDKGSHNTSGNSYFANKWLSPNKLHEADVPVFRELAATIEDSAKRWTGRTLNTSSMWSIISKSGMEGKPHGHAGVLSAAYYVDPGVSGETAGGLLRFYSNRTTSSPSHVVKPQAGLLILFPSGLFHSVSRYVGEVQRIVVSANLR